ncbi:MAG: NUDIX domain-containing protein [Rickettsiales bacterium]|jgi:isopentenyldiphosphate isomerase|nr:NUDIX domain-containing protein [Rickettsiales bacterium]
MPANIISPKLKPRPENPEEILSNPDYTIFDSYHNYAYALGRWADTTGTDPKDKSDSNNDMLRVLTPSGIDTGFIAPRGFVHFEGLYHDAVIIALVALLKNAKSVNMNGQEITTRTVLMQQRAKDKGKHPNKWDISVAAHVLAQDILPSNGIYRELAEELDARLPEDIQMRDFQHFKSFIKQEVISGNNLENQYYHGYVFYVDPTALDIKYPDKEVQASKYVSLPEIREMANKDLLHPRTEWIEPLAGAILRIR